MQPRTGRTRQAQRDAAEMRVQTWASMTTEYQDRFLPPCCHKAVITTSTQRKRCHPLKGTSNDISTYRSVYVTHRRMKRPKAPLPSVPGVHQGSGAAAGDSTHGLANPQAPASTDYTSVYKKDFQAWNISKRQPCRIRDSQTVSHGPGPCQKDPNSDAVARTEARPPVQGTTSYRADYVAHPLPQPANRKLVHQTNKGVTLDPAAGHTDLGPRDGANELFERFHNCSLTSKRRRRSSEPAEPALLSTTHYTAQPGQRTKPVLPPMKPAGKAKEPFHTTTTMREDYRAWHWATHGPVPAQDREPKKSLRPTPELHPDARDSTLRLQTRKPAESVTAEPGRPAANHTFSAFHCSDKESRLYWSASWDRGGSMSHGQPALADQAVGFQG